MGHSNIFTADFKAAPYWWDTAMPVSHTTAQMPQSADIAIVGGGYTGLHAAIQTARAGQSTVVIDAERAGWGCSTRNGGQISTSVKPSFAKLARKFGETRAADMLREGQSSLDYVKQFVRTEKIDCAFETAGRFNGAHSERHFEQLARACATPDPVIETGAYVVPRSEQHTEIGTDIYYGGAVYPKYGTLDVGRYFNGILKVAETSGAQVVSHCPVTAIERTGGGGFQLSTARGQVRARKVILATNGYTGPLTPWHRRRLIPIGSYVIATEEIDPAVMDRLMPSNRVFCDTRRLVYYYRPSPDRKRILFGGRVSVTETDPRASGPKLRAEMIRLFPELKDVQISHSWMGFVAYTLDTLMHTGHHDGLYYALGYCGSGVGMASYLGMRIGRQAAGLSDHASAFDDIPFPAPPLYGGNPWFLAPTVLTYRVLDRLGI